MSDIQCKCCRFWKNGDDNDFVRAGVYPPKHKGECRRHAPILNADSSIGEFAETSATDWCGEFRAIESPSESHVPLPEIVNEVANGKRHRRITIHVPGIGNVTVGNTSKVYRLYDRAYMHRIRNDLDAFYREVRRHLCESKENNANPH